MKINRETVQHFIASFAAHISSEYQRQPCIVRYEEEKTERNKEGLYGCFSYLSGRFSEKT
jgi:hypothetical protein